MVLAHVNPPLQILTPLKNGLLSKATIISKATVNCSLSCCLLPERESTSITSWTTTSLPTGIVEVLDMQPIDASTVFGVGGNSGGSPKNNFIRSSDGGATWTPSDAGVGHFGTDRLVHLDFLSAMTGWVVGHVGQVGFTTDGGVSFANKSPAGDATQYDDLQAVSASTVYIAGRFGTIKKTTDTGASKGAQLRNN